MRSLLSTFLAAAATLALAGGSRAELAKATFAGGCYWCVEELFDTVAGVSSVTSGFAKAALAASPPAEAVEVLFDPAQVPYEKLLYIFWRNVDPLTANRQFCDGGPQYRSAIYVHDDEQRRLAEASKAELEATRRFQKPIVTEILAAGSFQPVPESQQEYYKKNPARYTFYKRGCGRDARLKKVWGEEAGGGVTH